mgnify:CR=1 FL=1
MIQNVLAERYASPAISKIWSAEGRIVLEREFWIAVMKAQKELGLDIPQEAIDAFVQWLDKETNHGTIVVGHNILDYDLPVLAKYTRRLEGVRALDTLPMVRDIYPFIRNFKLTTIYKHTKGPNVRAHRALADVRMCIRVLDRAKARLEGAGLGLSMYVKRRGWGPK